VKLPHPVVLLLGGVALAAALTWLVPPGEFERRDDPVTGRRIVVAGTYHSMPASPVGPFAAATAVPRGFAVAADVVGVILFVGGAWFVLERLGSLGVALRALVRLFERRAVLGIVAVSMFFGTMGALENMQEEIIPLVPVLLVMGRGLGFDAVTCVAMSIGAAGVGSAFGPTNPFQAGIALKLAREAPLSGGGLRLAMLVAGLALWIGTTIRHASAHRSEPDRSATPSDDGPQAGRRHWLAISAVLLPMALYVVGALRFGWGFDQLSAAFFVGAFAAGLIGGWSLGRTATTYLEGMQGMIPAAVLVGIARSISIVLEDGRIVDTLLGALAAPLAQAPAMLAALLMIPFHGIVHVAVPSVSGHAVLTMPLMVPLSDLLHLPRQVPVLAYQTGAGLMDVVTPTNGALMAVLLAAGVTYQRWLAFTVIAIGVQVLVGVAGITAALLLGAAPG
jgi:uncharacterized ion transporter superfamily protein YfcC